jgi:excinuclease ABC subunit C
MNLKKKVSSLPSAPGVYLMKDSQNSVIYVGKSKNLKSRVGSYFQNSKSHSPKVVKLVKNINDFEYLLTDTEFEAFLLECQLIQEIKPIYNKKMKSPRSYCYIKITINEKYPDIEFSNECNTSDRNLYFGPYTSKNTVEAAIQGIKECCKIMCTNKSKKGAACLNYSLGLCIGTCINEDTKEKYNLIMQSIINLLSSYDKGILNEMEAAMNAASEKFDFESAAKYRDYISKVNYLIGRKEVIEFTEENKNIAMIEYLTNDSFKFFIIKGRKVLFSENYVIDSSDLEDVKTAIKKSILSYFKNEAPKTSIEISKDEIDEAQIIFSYLKGQKSNCRHVVIPEEWLNDETANNITSAINELLGFNRT